MLRAFGTGLLAACWLLWIPVPLRAQTPSSADCADCHAEGDEEVPAITLASLEGSIHEGLDCVDCHADVVELPHDEPLARVVCGSCHEDEAAAYTHHGRATVGAVPDIPICQDCHGTHDIRPSSDTQSRVNFRNLPDTCGRCHRDTNLAKAHDILLKRPVEVYEASVHGQINNGDGSVHAATCNDCHGSDGTSHRILAAGDPQSTINHFNIPKTCGKCHGEIAREYGEGIHGQLSARGLADSPVCTTCHGEHGILRHGDPRARVSPTRVAESTCVPCHESASLNEKYGVPGTRIISRVDSYHGLKSQAGDTRVANCASCHGAHKILPSTDPASSIYPANLTKTCGGCHPGIEAEIATTTKIHGPPDIERAGWAGIITGIYRLLIVTVIGGMLAYVVIDFLRQQRELRKGPQVRRMDGNAIAQHALLTIAFITLVVTGFALRYADTWLFQALFGWDGGSRVRGTAHRTAAVLFTLGCVWHLVFLRSAGGRRFLRDMLPRLSDLQELKQMMAFNLGRSRQRPRFGRFGYVEKAEYWALIWGAVVMFATGAFLWFENRLVHLFPKGTPEVMLVIHFYEAVLATLAIAVWHMYSVVLNPAVYPGNPAWITGTMPAEMHHHEHAGEDLGAPDHDAEARDRVARRRDKLGDAPQEAL